MPRKSEQGVWKYGINYDTYIKVDTDITIIKDEGIWYMFDGYSFLGKDENIWNLMKASDKGEE
jgi:hypothetical protein